VAQIWIGADTPAVSCSQRRLWSQLHYVLAIGLGDQGARPIIYDRRDMLFTST
jgi:hypothetical protein